MPRVGAPPRFGSGLASASFSLADRVVFTTGSSLATGVPSDSLSYTTRSLSITCDFPVANFCADLVSGAAHAAIFARSPRGGAEVSVGPFALDKATVVRSSADTVDPSASACAATRESATGAVAEKSTPVGICTVLSGTAECESPEGSDGDPSLVGSGKARSALACNVSTSGIGAGDPVWIGDGVAGCTPAVGDFTDTLISGDAVISRLASATPESAVDGSAPVGNATPCSRSEASGTVVERPSVVNFSDAGVAGRVIVGTGVPLFAATRAVEAANPSTLILRVIPVAVASNGEIVALETTFSPAPPVRGLSATGASWVGLVSVGEPSLSCEGGVSSDQDCGNATAVATNCGSTCTGSGVACPGTSDPGEPDPGCLPSFQRIGRGMIPLIGSRTRGSAGGGVTGGGE